RQDPRPFAEQPGPPDVVGFEFGGQSRPDDLRVVADLGGGAHVPDGRGNGDRMRQRDDGRGECRTADGAGVSGMHGTPRLSMHADGPARLTGYAPSMCSSRIGSSRTRRPVAWNTALAIAGAIPTRAISPRPLTPS